MQRLWWWNIRGCVWRVGGCYNCSGGAIIQGWLALVVYRLLWLNVKRLRCGASVQAYRSLPIV